ncbi:MAG: MBL fold metallo-hydrolase [Clostridia bacterium]|nr:MBL fold metallo-hydrolase [Clostridia bacterium]
MLDFYRSIPIKENLYRIASPENVFCELLVGSERALLIDTGYGFGNLKAAVRRVTDKPLVIVNTHGHLDHVCGNAQFDEPVYIGQKDMPLCQIHTGREARARAAENAKHTLDYASGGFVYGLPEDFVLEAYLARGAGNLVACGEGAEFVLGGMTVRVYETPGHTPGGLSFHYLEENILYTGDAVGPFVWLFMPEATDRSTHIATTERIIDLGAARVYAAHGEQPMDNPFLRRCLRAAVEADYEKGFPFESPLTGATDARICTLDGMTPAELGRNPDFAAIVISPDR